MKSIFEIEIRINLIEEFESIYYDLTSEKVSSGICGPCTVMKYLKEAFKYWPHREGTSDLQFYMDRKGIYIDDEDDYPGFDEVKEGKYSEYEKVLYNLELYINLLHFATKFEKEHTKIELLTSFSNDRVENVTKRYIEDIEYILEQCNYRVREIENIKYTQYVISKRDAQVDSVLENNPNIAEVLLSYLDFRNATDIDFKKTANKKIADYLEPMRKDFKGTNYSNLCDTLFFAYNKCNIRHNAKDQIELSEENQIKLYDNAFRMAIHLMQAKEMKDIKTWVDGLK